MSVDSGGRRGIHLFTRALTPSHLYHLIVLRPGVPPLGSDQISQEKLCNLLYLNWITVYEFIQQAFIKYPLSALHRERNYR